MKDITLVHSFHSRHCNKEQLWMYICYFTLSCMYAKRSGFNIILHTDDKGKELLRFAPYDQVIVSLNNIKRPHHLFFAYPKFIVLDLMEKGQIHIDGDVFLKKDTISELFDFDDYDCIVQSIEKEFIDTPYDNPIWDNSRKSFENIEYPEWAKRFSLYMYNTGVMGFNNDELKREFVDTYWDMSNKFEKDGIDVPSCPEIIIEQQFLMDLCERDNLKVKTIIPKDWYGKKSLDFANNVGYQHVIGADTKRRKLTECVKTINVLDKNMIKNLVIIKNEIFNKK